MEKAFQIVGIVLAIIALIFFFNAVYGQYKPYNFLNNSEFMKKNKDKRFGFYLKALFGYEIDFKQFIYISILSGIIFLLGFISFGEATYALKNVTFDVNSRLWFYGGLLAFEAIGFMIVNLWIGKKKEALKNELLVKYLHPFTIFLTCVLIFSMSCVIEGLVHVIHYRLNPNLISIGGFHVAFYALFILTGAIFALIIATRKFTKMGYRKNILENLFYVAFPAGIIGSRIWYVIAEWSKEFANQPFTAVFEIWNGGLAIQGGIIGGALVGIIFMLLRRKNVNIFMAIDLCVPGILIAQAVGRLGNFFNFEVYGAEVARETFGFLPNWILNQMQVDLADPSRIYVPLFLIEAVVNVIGYFVLTYFVGGFLKKRNISIYGDCGFGYLIWYGVVRMIMEPLRNEKFIMGTDVQASRLMAIAFVVVGVLGIIVTHIINIWHKEIFINKPITPEDAGIEVSQEENEETL